MAKSGELKQRRLALNLRLTEFAPRLGKTAATLSRWESGNRRPNAADAVRWMRLLERLETATAAVQPPSEPTEPTDIGGDAA